MRTQKHIFEPITLQNRNSLICWRSVLGGLILAVITMMVFTFAGSLIAGVVSSNSLGQPGDGPQGVTIASLTGVWLILTSAISIFVGSYFAARMSLVFTTKVGIAHGLMVASVVFLLSLWGGGGIAANLSSGVSNIAKSVTSGMGNVSQNPYLQDMVQTAVGSSNLKSDPKDVAQGVMTRLLNGDVDSLKSYLSYQTGISQAEADQKVSQLKEKFDAKLKEIKEKTAHAVTEGSIALLIVFLIGMIAGSLGGAAAARTNTEHPLVKALA